MAEEFEPHAVRWALRMVRGERQYTRWHYTRSAGWTLCGHVIRLAVETFPPETNEPDRVDCRQCLSRLNAKD
jgi:hypothetical protein